MAIPTISLSVMIGYGVELVLLATILADIPLLSQCAGLLQLPVGIYALALPPPTIDPFAKAKLLAILFTTQGFLLSSIAYAMISLRRRITS